MTTHSPVDAFIVGEPKSGTTALAHFLDQHPAVTVARPKEPHYFATDLIRESDAYHGGKQRHFEVRTEKQYNDCFRHAEPGSVTVDASTHYLTSREAAKNISEYNPDAKIIMLLREPVAFVRSLHQQYVNNGSEDEPDFETALLKEAARKRGKNLPKYARCPSHHFYSERVKYVDHIKRFLNYFPRQNVLILINEEFAADNESTYRRVANFLGVDSSFTPAFSRVHGSKVPRYRGLHRILNHSILKQIIRSTLGPQRYDALKQAASRAFLKQATRPPLNENLRRELKQQFAPEVAKLARLLERPDLTQLWGYN